MYICLETGRLDRFITILAQNNSGFPAWRAHIGPAFPEVNLD